MSYKNKESLLNHLALLLPDNARTFQCVYHNEYVKFNVEFNNDVMRCIIPLNSLNGRYYNTSLWIPDTIEEIHNPNIDSFIRHWKMVSPMNNTYHYAMIGYVSDIIVSIELYNTAYFYYTIYDNSLKKSSLYDDNFNDEDFKTLVYEYNEGI